MKNILLLFFTGLISCNNFPLNDNSREKPAPTSGLKIETPAEANQRKGIPKNISDFMIEVSIEKMYSTELHRHALTHIPQTSLSAVAKHAFHTDTMFIKKLKALAKKKNITLPIVMDKKHHRKYEELISLKDSSACKKEYIKLFLESLEVLEEIFEKGAENFSDTHTKAYTNNQLRILNHRIKDKPCEF